MGTLNEVARQGSNRRKAGRRQDIAFLLVGLNDFDKIDAAYGDDVAFAALKILADLLRHNIRHDDMLIHKGNGEFVIMLSGVDDTHADDVILRRLQRLLDSDLILTIGRERIRIHAKVMVFSAGEYSTPFGNASEISVFMAGSR